ncbi:sensor histidine kinase [Paenibacillus sp. GCM10012303]|jgi:two-component system sensor histidine kinase YesM|uniref:sensor histidine kinase n=1 Tax=Paenibacillus sp. GCM10012303 TaxID=3317340 RepID=UPI00361F3992
MKERSNIWFYIKHFKIHSIFLRNFLIIVCLMILPVAGMSAAVYVVYGKVIQEEIGAVHHIALSRLRDMIDMTIREVDEFALQAAADPAAGRLFAEPRPDRADADLFNQIHLLRQRLTPVTKLSSQFINSVYLYMDTSGYVLSTNLGLWDSLWFLDKGWIPEYERRKSSESYWVSAREATQYVGEQRERHFLSFFYTAPLDKKNKRGAIVVNVDAARLGQFINNVSDPYLEDIYIADRDGIVLYNRDFSLINRRLSDIEPLRQQMQNSGSKPDSLSSEGTTRSITSLRSQYNDWTFVSVLPLQVVQEKNAYLRRYVFVIFAAGLAVALLLALIIAAKVFQPIRKVLSIVENPDKWSAVELERREPRLNEIRQIAATIVRSHGKRIELEQELRKRLTLLKQAQNVALQSQINPHFLYNTLETINWNAIRLTGGENKVSEMIASLAMLLRLSLETPTNLIPIREELEHVQHYLDLLAVRYKNSFAIEWEIEESIRSCRIPKITLQPIVENAIYHGIKPKRGQGVVRITGRRQGEQIVLDVTDDGVGIGPEQTERINAAMKEDYSEPGDHIGIKNVNQRIKLTFGDEYGLAVSSEPGIGTTVRLTIPVVE